MKAFVTTLGFLSMAFYSHAQINIYWALTIPDSLKKDADVIIREENIKLTIKDKNTAWLNVHQVFTVLNEQAKKSCFSRSIPISFGCLMRRR